MLMEGGRLNQIVDHELDADGVRIADMDRLADKIGRARARGLPLFLLIIATKPCYIKLAPVILEAKRQDVPLVTIDTGHHYSDELTGAARDFAITAEIDLYLNIRGSMLERTSELALRCQELAALLARLGAPLPSTYPVVSGDTSTSATFPLFWYLETGARCMHIESGLRSRSPFPNRDITLQDVQMQRDSKWVVVPDEPFPEGIDTRVTSVVARRLYAPLDNNRAELVREGYRESDILITGSLSADAVAASLADGQTAFDGVASRRLRFDVHRRENMTPDRLEAIMGAAIALVSDGFQVEFVLTNQIKLAFERHQERGFRRRLEAAGVECRPIMPSYTGFLRSVASGRYRALVTDSGGLQEECAILGVPCCTLRYSTDRPETVLRFGGNILAPPSDDRLIVGTLAWFLDQRMPKAGAVYGSEVAKTIVSDLTSGERRLS